MRTTDKPAQGMVVAILILCMAVAAFFINLIIKRSVEKENFSLSQRPALTDGRHSPQDQKAVGFYEDVPMASNSASIPEISSKTGQKTGAIPDKEIIYEPSIKGELLLQ